ncbi:hypothetical protein BDB00DRAFT_825457 [Zychaea mexicana]|uniref:uncharacterized protein n=1 Tax=Zychaea mexicana TaxID=64656 RepID=UPI0022FE2768|nr:uncharacterized protein BDB00DRAFT_825457 [Zychaea mexicana]KAI9492971.1 hypothetical protein BDB00DRAFT_825457 [Zychaea mexicana]
MCVIQSLWYFHCYTHGAQPTVHTDHTAMNAILSSQAPKERMYDGLWRQSITTILALHEKVNITMFESHNRIGSPENDALLGLQIFFGI